ncbi:MAG: DUF6452 family protein [Salinivirgaceae bacterium]|nr:DUF6452 family protein [Salinivirgaceae bacterium]
MKKHFLLWVAIGVVSAFVGCNQEIVDCNDRIPGLNCKFIDKSGGSFDSTSVTLLGTSNEVIYAQKGFPYGLHLPLNINSDSTEFCIKTFTFTTTTTEVNADYMVVYAKPQLMVRNIECGAFYEYDITEPIHFGAIDSLQRTAIDSIKHKINCHVGQDETTHVEIYF